MLPVRCSAVALLSGRGGGFLSRLSRGTVGQIPKSQKLNWLKLADASHTLSKVLDFLVSAPGLEPGTP